MICTSCVLLVFGCFSTGGAFSTFGFLWFFPAAGAVFYSSITGFYAKISLFPGLLYFGGYVGNFDRSSVTTTLGIFPT